jgi:CRP/FNR family transcriptional regulator, cyclic AMP receptor protein
MTRSTHALSEELFARLAQRGDAKHYARDEVLIREGDASDALYILMEGQLKVFSRDERGRELVYNIITPGEFFGEMFLDGGPRSASVKAVTEADCIVINQHEIRSFMRTYPEFAECLVHKLIARLRHATRFSRSLALDGAYERTLALLDQIAVTEGDIRFIPPRVTQQDIADRVAVSREMINHIMRGLLRDGLIVRDEKRRGVLSRDFPRRA